MHNDLKMMAPAAAAAKRGDNSDRSGSAPEAPVFSTKGGHKDLFIRRLEPEQGPEFRKESIGRGIVLGPEFIPLDDAPELARREASLTEWLGRYKDHCDLYLATWRGGGPRTLSGVTLEGKEIAFAQSEVLRDASQNEIGFYERLQEPGVRDHENYHVMLVMLLRRPERK